MFMKMLKRNEVAAAIGIGKTKLYEMIKEKNFMVGYGDGRFRRWPENQVSAFQILLYRLPEPLPEVEATTLAEIKKMAESAQEKMFNETAQ